MEFCASRTNQFPREGETNVTCYDSGDDITFTYPCGRYLEHCDDIFIAIRSKSDASQASCTCKLYNFLTKNILLLRIRMILLPIIKLFK